MTERGYDYQRDKPPERQTSPFTCPTCYSAPNEPCWSMLFGGYKTKIHYLRRTSNISPAEYERVFGHLPTNLPTDVRS